MMPAMTSAARRRQVPWRVVGVCAHAPKGLVDRSCTWRRTVGDFSHRLSFRGPYLASYHTTIERHHTPHSMMSSYGSMTSPVGLSATTGTTAVMAATIPARSHPPSPPHTRADGRTGGRAGDDARTGGRTYGASMGRTCGRSCACVDVRGRVFRVVPPRDVSAPPRRTHRAMHRQVGYRAVGRLNPSGPAIKSSRSIRTTEKLNLRASRGALGRFFFGSFFGGVSQLRL